MQGNGLSAVMTLVEHRGEENREWMTDSRFFLSCFESLEFHEGTDICYTISNVVSEGYGKPT